MMPFTISHAAAAMPFRRTRLVISALIIGCMAPDFEYFLHAGMFGRESHNIRGAFEFALPATLIALAAFHVVLKRPLAALLPNFLQERIVFEEFHFWPLKRFLMVALSALIGIATHLLWDSFTHAHGRAVMHLPWLMNEVTIFGRDVPYYKVAQHSSTLFGLAVLAIWIAQYFRSHPPHSLPDLTLSPFAKSAIVVTVLMTAFIVGYWRAEALVGPSHRKFSGDFVANSVVAFVSVAVLELMIFSILMRLRTGEQQS